MPTVQQYYPPLSDLIDASSIPGELTGLENLVQQGVNVLLDKIYYKDLSVDVSHAADRRLYRLTLVTKSLKLPAFAGMNLVFFRGQANLAEYNIVLEWSWPLMKYVRRFEVQGFSYAPEAFVDILLELADIRSRQEFFSSIVKVFLNDGSNTYLSFFNSLATRVQTYNNGEPAVNTEIQNIVTNIQAIRTEVEGWLTSTTMFRAIEIFERYTSYPALNNAVTNIRQSLETLDNMHNIQVNLFADVIVILLESFSNADEKFKRLLKLFREWLKDIEIEDIKAFLLPQFSLGLNNINLALEFPRKWLIPVYTGVEPVTGLNINDPLPEPYVSALEFTAGSVRYSTALGFQFENQSSFTFKRSMIGRTGIILEIINLKVDLSRTHNIAEADADQRLPEFVGVYAEEVSITFPQYWNHDISGSTAVVKARKLLIGTGGISGIITLESATPNGSALFRFGNAGNTNKHFELGLTQFLIEFKQNAIVQSEISGYMKIPGLKDAIGNPALIDIKAHIGNNGDFRVTASEADGLQPIGIENVFSLTLRSVSIGRENDRWYIEASGSLQILVQIPHVETDFLKQPIDIKKLRIYQDGSIEFVGGGIALPTHVHINLGPVSLAMDHMGFHPHEGTYNGVKRQYFCITFDGSLNVGGGSVNVRGDGFEFHFTRDAGTFHSYVRIAGIGIDIKIPANASKEDADVFISGYLAMRHGVDAQGNALQSGPEYQGAVEVHLNKLRIHAKASMILRPKVPAYIVDVELEIPTPIPLGPTGLGIYGFRGLIGNHYVASKPYIGLNEDDSWFEYLKKKVPPRNKQGIGIEKFDPGRKGFSLGVGATIATMGDDGWAFSSKVFIMISLPELLLIEGQANVLHKRLGINSEDDPPFYAFLILDKNSVQAGIGVNYKLPDSGEILALRGEMQMAFFFSNSTAWYINIGRDLPEDKRIQARLFTLFNAYAYVMISNKGIKAGAGAKFEMQKRFGPVRLGLYAFIDTKGFISFKPIQIGGAIVLGGGVYIRVGRFGIELHVTAGLSAEAPMPFVISGFVQIKIKIVFFKIRIKLEFTWIIRRELNTAEVKLLDPGDFLGLPAGSAQYPFKAINMLSGESFTLKYLPTGIEGANPETDSSWNNFTIPMDSFIDIEFKRGVKPYTTRYGGGINPLPQFVEYVAPQQARMPQVKHSFTVDKVEIWIWNPIANNWATYDPWSALTSAFQNAGLTVNTSTFNFGYWQYNNVPGKYTSLRLLSQSPFAVANGLPPENFGILSEHILCQGQLERKTCQYWRLQNPATMYPAPDVLRDRNLLLRFTDSDGSIGNMPNVFGIDPSLKVKDRNRVEIFFREPMPQVNLSLTSLNGARITYYKKVYTGAETISTLPHYEYEMVYEAEYGWGELMNTIDYEDGNNPVSKVMIEANACSPDGIGNIFLEYWSELYNRWTQSNDGLEQWQIDQIALWLSTYGSGGGNPGAIALATLCAEWNNFWQYPMNEPTYAMLTNWTNKCDRLDYENVFAELCADWTQILANPENYPLIAGHVWEWREMYCNGGIPGSGEFDLCSLYVHEVCWLAVRQYEFNMLLQQNNQSVITVGMNTLQQAINEALPPVWRPDSAYAVVVHLRDALTVGGAANANYAGTFAFGFKTSGTLGFFHQADPAYTALLSYQDPVSQQFIDKTDQYKLANLRHYIDYQRSYPNADGKILCAKPLYYKMPKLGIFFIKPYVYEFFTRWDAYAENPAKEYQLHSIIMDPLDLPGEPPAIPAEVIGWQVKMGAQSIPVNAVDIETISNILSQGQHTCMQVIQALHPPTVNAEVQRTYDLKPQKLYAAVYKAIEVIPSGNRESVVHTYTFETSRYGNFTEHITSYIRSMTDIETGQVVVSNAFFPLILPATTSVLAVMNNKLQQIIGNTLPVNDPLIAQYASIYDRIVSGVFEMEALQAATGTEFNVIKTMNTDTNAITVIGILVKSPEPFNDPKLPATEMPGTLTVTDATNNNTQFNIVFAKDNSAVFVTNSALSLPLHTLNFAFKYKKYNGVTYAITETVTVPVNLAAI